MTVEFAARRSSTFRRWTDKSVNQEELVALWNQVRERLSDAARLLPATCKSHDEGGSLSAYVDWLEQNELELAFDELEALGDVNDVCHEYWEHLSAAAHLMGLSAREARCRARASANRR